MKCTETMSLALCCMADKQHQRLLALDLCKSFKNEEIKYDPVFQGLIFYLVFLMTVVSLNLNPNPRSVSFMCLF